MDFEAATWELHAIVKILVDGENDGKCKIIHMHSKTVLSHAKTCDAMIIFK